MTAARIAEWLRFGAALRAARERRGLGLRPAALRAGLSRGYLSALERGRAKNPTIQVLQAIADAIGVKLEVHLIDTEAT